MKVEEIMLLFPDFLEITDENLRFKAIQATALAMESGGWTFETAEQAPVTLNWPDCRCNLIEHVRTVTRVCLSTYEQLAPFYKDNGVPFDRDTVACGALLHDIGKWTEFCLKDGKPVHSETSDLLRHPLSGAILADRAGLPVKIVHLIATHSFEGERSYKTAESDFVRSIDEFVFHCTVYGLQKK